MSSTPYIAILNFKTMEVDVSSGLGDKIREHRKKKGYTLEKLAELTESSKSYIWELENKSPLRPSADKVARIASALGVTSDYLVDRTEKTDVAEATDQAFAAMIALFRKVFQP